MSASRNPASLCALLAAAVIPLAGLWWVTAGTFDLLKPWNFGNVYEDQTDSLLSGRADVRCNIATGEAFIRDGKCYLYFGPAPGLLRLPLLWLKPEWTGRLSGAMVWMAHLLLLLAVGLILVEAGHAFGTWTSTFYLLLTAFGSTIPNMWGWPTTWVEAISLALALGACSLYCLLRWARLGSGAWLIGAGLLAMLAFFTRISTGAGPLLAVGVAAAIEWRGKPRCRGAAAVATLLLVGLSILGYVALNKARMGTYWNAVPIHLHVQYDAERLARIDGTLLHPEKGLPVLAGYLLDPPRFRGGFPWLEFQPGTLFEPPGMDFVDLHAGVLPTMPALAWLALAGLLGSRGKRRWTLLSPLVGIVLLVTVAAIAQRYVHEFVLLLAPAGAFGLHWAMATRTRRWITYLLSAWSVYCCCALALVHQREVMYWVNQDALDRYCTVRSEIDGFISGHASVSGAERVRIRQTGSTYEFDGNRWHRCAGAAAGLFRIQVSFTALPEEPVKLLVVGKLPEADTITLERAAGPGRYRVRMDHPGKPSEWGTEFELVPQREYLFETEIDRMHRRLSVKLDGALAGQRKTGLVRWIETEVTVGAPGRWIGD